VVVHNFVVENGEVKSESKSDWVACVEGCGGLAGLLVVLEGTILDSVELISGSALSNVSVVVTDHLVEECLGLVGSGLTHALALNDINNRDALVVELLLDLLFVLGETFVEFGVFWVLLDRADGPNGGSLGSDLVFETNGKEISLLSSEILLFGFNNSLEESDHIVESLGLLSHSGHENVLF
jgi:hypothetical protein